jgi:hypothetical protein
METNFTNGESVKSRKLRLISFYMDTDEHFNQDENKIFISFVNEKGVYYSGAITYKQLFNSLKKFLRKNK